MHNAGAGGAMAPTDDPFNARLSTLMLGPGHAPSTSHATQRSWEDIPMFNPQFASAPAAAGNSPEYSAAQPQQSGSRQEHCTMCLHYMTFHSLPQQYCLLAALNETTLYSSPDALAELGMLMAEGLAFS